jgi:hypothetical protein
MFVIMQNDDKLHLLGVSSSREKVIKFLDNKFNELRKSYPERKVEWRNSGDAIEVVGGGVSSRQPSIFISFREVEELA